MSENKIHKTHFTVPELPHKKMEREAILLLRKILNSWINETGSIGFIIDTCSDDLIDWVMKYKGE